MQSFLEEVIDEVWEKHPDLDKVIFVLPSKRAGTFLKNVIATKSKSPLFLPEVYSIERFVEEISGLVPVNSTQQLMELYHAYRQSSYPDKDDFFTFSKWGRTLLQDIIEVDRYLIDSEKLFSNLSQIQQINHWSLELEKTPMMTAHLKFWEGLNELYNLFNAALLTKGLGHQGLIYRKAFDHIEEYIASRADIVHVFIGFNALNTAESQILQKVLSHTKSHIYWDLDRYFFEDPVHDASYFIRNHIKKWPYFQNHPPKGISNDYLSKKEIEIIGIPKNVGQAKYVGHLLKHLNETGKQGLPNTAVVLSDETLLNPLLNSLPAEIENVNVTMGYPLDKTSVATMFSQLLHLHLQRSRQGWYYKDILDLLSHPLIDLLVKDQEADALTSLPRKIRLKNWSYVSYAEIEALQSSGNHLIQLFFTIKIPSPKEFVQSCQGIIMRLKNILQNQNDPLSLEHLYRFHTLFNQISELLSKFDFIKDLKSLRGLYSDLLASETLDFRGEPLQGLQIMGMLESRNLDFETIIITSVNEGILPSGKTNNSFIPFDLKLHQGLPTYKEKDAVYTYHFYRLLQRAKRVYLLYNTEPDVLEGGERSRLITQLLTDEKRKGDIVQKTAAPRATARTKKVNSISKDKELLLLLKEYASKGFSPTSLSNYIRSPLDFYKMELLGIKDLIEVEETVAANTFGTIIHDTLETVYTPFIGTYLSKAPLESAISDIEKVVKSHFALSYPGSDISKGKNLIAFQVILRYIKNFLRLEIEQLDMHRTKILALEARLETRLQLPEIGYPIVIKGKLDRIDEQDGITRIIDYKTGTVVPSELEVYDWSQIIEEYRYSKAFQLLCYAWLFQQNNPSDQLHAGIISFKKLNTGLLRFAQKNDRNSRNKQWDITHETLQTFQSKLKQLLLEIYDPEIPFAEKEN